jgi:hypothetical protein
MRNASVGAVILAAAGLSSAAMAQVTETIVVPLEVHGGRLVVPARTADGTELAFVVSTGSGVTVLSESTAALLGAQPELSLGGTPVAMEGRRTLPDEGLVTEGRAMAGMIGSNTLNRFDVLVDVPGGRLALKPVGRSVSWEGVTLSEPVRLRVFHGVILGLDVEVNGKEYPALLDLGTPTLVVNERVMKESAVQGGKVRAFRVGDTTLPGLPVRHEELDAFRMMSRNGEGVVLVGAPLAHECAVSLSWVHRELRTCVR